MAAKVPAAIWIVTVVLINGVVSSRLPQTVAEKRNIDGRISINDNNGNRKERSVSEGTQFNLDSLNAVYRSESLNKQGDIVFPDQITEGVEARSGTVPSCSGETLCEDVPDYPTNLMNYLIERNPDIRRYQIDDMSEFIKSKSNIPEAQQLCTSYKKVIYPRKGKSTSGEWMYIANTPNFTQGVLVEICRNEGTTCSIIHGLALNYVTTCKQKFIFRELYAINGTTLEREPFMLRASCCCHVELKSEEIGK